MTCPRRERLEARFRQVTATYDNARQHLLERVATCSQAECLALTDAVDRAGDLLNHYQNALDLHIRQHACLAKEGARAAGGATQ
jgi:hypothetical protein